MPLFSRSPRRQPRPAPAPGEAIPAPVVSIADHALAEIAAAAEVVLHPAGVAIALESRGQIVCRARAGQIAPEIGTVVEPGRGITGECVASGAAIACPDTDRDPRVNAELCRELGIRSLLLVPLRWQGRVVGVIEALFAAPGLFDERAVASLEKFAAQIVARAYGGLDTEDTEDAEEFEKQKIEIAESPVSSVVEPAVVSDTAVAESPPEVLPMFVQVAERKEPPYAVMLAVVIVATLLVIGILVLSRYGYSIFAARPTVQTGDPDAWVRLRKAAEGGDAAAQYYLALAYEKGSGVPREEAQAAAWLRKSAEQGHADAQYELAQALENGRGVTADRVEACVWYVVSGMGGNSQGQQAFERLAPSLSQDETGRVRLRLGEMHAAGTAVPRSVVSAYRWYALADMAGNAEAKALMAGLSSEMTPRQIAEAKSRARAWAARHPAR